MTSHPISVAVLGTGIMGAAMARSMLRAGLRVSAWNRTFERARPLADDGARVTGTAAEAVDGADVVLTMVHDGPAVLDVLRAAAPGPRPGTIWLQCTTVGLASLPEFTGLAHERGLVLVDAPVLGTRGPAEEGELTVLAAGPPDVRDRLAPVLEAVASRVSWVDDEPGAATRLKLVCNSWVLAVNNGVAETLALARGLGVDPQDFLDAVAGGGLDMGYLRMKADAIRSGDFTPSFAVHTAEKDARLIVEAGERAGVRLDMTAAGAERFRRAAEQGHGDEDMAASYYAGFDGGPSGDGG